MKDSKCLVLSERWVDSTGKSRFRMIDVALWLHKPGSCVRIWDLAMADKDLRATIAYRQSGAPSFRGMDYHGWRNVAPWERATIDAWREKYRCPPKERDSVLRF